VNPPPKEYHIPVIFNNQTGFEIINNNTDLSEQQIQDCFQNGAVWFEIQGRPVRHYDTTTILKPGHKIHCYCNHTTLTACPYKPELVSDHKTFSIWSKPSGMLSQGSKWGDHWTLQRWIKLNYWPDRDSLITHRLDRYTQGLMIVAHTQEVNKLFHKLFENRKIIKTYRAIVSGQMNIGKKPKLTTPIEGKQAETKLTVIDVNTDQNTSLIELKPKTGRKHQIRVHLAEAGHPVINDRQYSDPPHSGDLQLQASELEFSHPLTGEKIHITLPTPLKY